MLRRDAKYGAEMKKRAAEFAAGVEGVDIPAAVKPELKRLLGDYQRDFQAWMEAALQRGAELKATADSFSAVEPVIEAVSKSVGDIRAEAERQNAIERDHIQWQME